MASFFSSLNEGCLTSPCSLIFTLISPAMLQFYQFSLYCLSDEKYNSEKKAFKQQRLAGAGRGVFPHCARDFFFCICRTYALFCSLKSASVKGGWLSSALPVGVFWGSQPAFLLAYFLSDFQNSYLSSSTHLSVGKDFAVCSHLFSY